MLGLIETELMLQGYDAPIVEVDFRMNFEQSPSNLSELERCLKDLNGGGPECGMQLVYNLLKSAIEHTNSADENMILLQK